MMDFSGLFGSGKAASTTPATNAQGQGQGFWDNFFKDPNKVQAMANMGAGLSQGQGFGQAAGQAAQKYSQNAAYQKAVQRQKQQQSESMSAFIKALQGNKIVSPLDDMSGLNKISIGPDKINLLYPNQPPVPKEKAASAKEQK